MPSSNAEIKPPARMPSAPKRAEEVQRAAHVFQQEANRQQIEEHAERAPDAVVALAPLAIHVLDRNLADATRHTS